MSEKAPESSILEEIDLDFGAGTTDEGEDTVAAAGGDDTVSADAGTDLAAEDTVAAGAGDDTTAGGAGDDTVVAGAGGDNTTTTTTTTTAKVEEPPVVDAKTKEQLERDAAARTQHQERVDKFKADHAALRKKVTDGQYDPITDGATATQVLLEGMDLIEGRLGEVRQHTDNQQQQKTYDAHWSTFDSKNTDLAAGTGRQLWEKTLDELSKRGYAGPALQGAAEIEFDHRIGLAKAERKTNPGNRTTTTPPKPNVTKGGARVTAPNPTTTAPSTPGRRMTAEEKLQQGRYGNLVGEINV